MFNVNLSDTKTKHIATHLDPRQNPTGLECLMKWAKSTRPARHEFRTVHTLIQGGINIWRNQVVVDNTKMESIYLLEAVGSALPASFPETGS